jgi:hypothetical protein
VNQFFTINSPATAGVSPKTDRVSHCQFLDEIELICKTKTKINLSTKENTPTPLPARIPSRLALHPTYKSIENYNVYTSKILLNLFHDVHIAHRHSSCKTNHAKESSAIPTVSLFSL